MKKILFLLGICTVSFYQSQTNRFIYEMQFRTDNTQEYKKALMNLDISPKSVKFYDKTFADYDSINKSSQMGNSHFSTKTDQVIERQPNSFKNNWYRDFFEYFVIKTNDEMKWKLFSDTQTYNGYTLQKATTDFGGRQWTAWFSKETDIKEGPYKFRGLPGLIFIIEDDKKDFIYKLVKNIKLPETYSTKDFVETHYGKAALPISIEKFNKYLEDTYSDPVRMFSDGVKNGGSTFGKETVESMEELNKKKAMLQKGIKSRYIYIEKDKEPKFN
ncbi:GLPGLI family protein [Chryseobacterium camelliae]|uniref:GLPGLI family protein n=1 Tax=Chryseobacterium camelliae TaxID=1265445 RepID=A0ABY7QM88_9FLAO|nr:GLPGLI family protein [Chryseobacterium camelliae]WBV60797.1 GLPGLI family protein [Chryseobacterium camelliae]